jgi:peroxiredoxin
MQRNTFTEGEPFPVLALPDLEHGRPTSLADFRGRKLVLQVFASW